MASWTTNRAECTFNSSSNTLQAGLLYSFDSHGSSFCTDIQHWRGAAVIMEKEAGGNDLTGSDAGCCVFAQKQAAGKQKGDAVASPFRII
ncbi:hypothetical protein [Aeromonas dhakensis]|uniref:hypothetical protein n=1 Tax=Aeromonas dhakensis TaxID=196024 RepID=UPI00197D492D|nr:hypothetical protein [Aeromonas dhakensis]MBW3732227.1 hypothetical protein [Aeromonas dhakensis]MED7772542.1 hypothetical protein [Aeromonas dhakensis]QSR56804.1 hypothetical protein GO601_15960 [Aeromonas dhakensis]HDT5886795.1 hypothetical protein [Aeromonas dhakensis]HEB4978493.1 hypothetical protein [Aeromonas dhakensis]